MSSTDDARFASKATDLSPMVRRSSAQPARDSSERGRDEHEALSEELTVRG
jgi:hypothetical protein